MGVDSWSHGQSLVNYMKLVSGSQMIFYIYFLSLDGNVLTDPLLQIEIGGLTIERGVEVMIEGIQTVGTWNQTEEGAN